MRRILPFAVLLWSSSAMAAVINFEIQFTPFVGDISKSEVQTVPGKARVYLNNLPIAEQEVDRKGVPVLFEKREVAPAVWVPAKSLGTMVRKGRNTIRIEFVPEDATVPYQARLQWNEVTDQVKESRSGGAATATNRGGEGMETRPSRGKVVLEREFSGDFAADQPWHHYPVVAALTDDDRQKLAALAKERADAFKPNFEGVYKLLAGRPELQIPEIRKAKCLEKAHAAGVRVPVPGGSALEFATTGSAAIVIGRKGGELYPFDPKSFERIKGDEARMCAGITLSIAYPPRLIAAKSPQGRWEVVF